MKHLKVSHLALVLILSASLFYGCGGIVAEEDTGTTASDNATGTPDSGGGSDGEANFTTEMQKLLAPDVEVGDIFGYSVSISGDYAIVGSIREDSMGYRSGAAYIFYRDPATDKWDSGTKITAPDAEDGDEFGVSVGISGDYAIVGAWREASFGDFAGAAYIFHRTGTNSWDSGVKVVPSEISADLRYGYAVAIDGDYAVVGAAKSNGVYVFHRTGTNSWDSGEKLVDPENGYLDSFGTAVAIDGDYIVAGVQGRNLTPSSTAGEAYIFHRTGTNSWDGGTEIVSSDLAQGDHFGISVSISGDYAVVGASHDTHTGIYYAGSAYIFHRIGTNSWDAGTKVVDPSPESVERFGFSLALKGNYLAIGSVGSTINNLTNVGSVHVFERTGTNSWSVGPEIIASDGYKDDGFSASVSIGSNYMISAAPYEDKGGRYAGAVYFFK